MFRKIAIVVVVLLAAVLAFAAMKPDTFRVQRATSIKATNVTWGMHGPAPFFSKVMQVFVDMDSMVGKDFEVGLANLKAVAEN